MTEGKPKSITDQIYLDGYQAGVSAMAQVTTDADESYKDGYRDGKSDNSKGFYGFLLGIIFTIAIGILWQVW